jgi:uncharacterized integral membrane protein
MVLFSLQNTAPVAVTFLSWKFVTSLSDVILLSVLIGILIGITFSLSRYKRSPRNKRIAAHAPAGREPQP